MSDRRASELVPRFPWWWLAAPIVASAAVRGFWAPDEPRYAMVAKSIYEHGEFLVLRRCGELYPDKPPLVYWFAGFFVWRYYAYLDDVSQEAEWGFSPHGKAAERVLRACFASGFGCEPGPAVFLPR